MLYLRTSSAANVGTDKDSDRRQRAAIAAFAKAHGYHLIDEFYDAAVSGADPVTDRPGFKDMLDRIAGNGVRMILVESPDRFARDLAVQWACKSRSSAPTPPTRSMLSLDPLSASGPMPCLVRRHCD